MIPTVKAGLAVLCLTAGAAAAEPLAIVFGNESYQRFPNAAGADNFGPLSTALRDLGVSVFSESNGTRRNLDAELGNMARAFGTGDAMVVYLAGRFAHSATETWYLPIDARASSVFGLADEGVALSTVLAYLSEFPGRAVLALSDAGAMDTPSPLLSGGVGELDIPQGVTVLSGDGPNLQAVVEALAGGEAALDPESLARVDISADGYMPRDGRLPLFDIAVREFDTPDPRAAEIAYWEAARDLNSVEGYENYLDRYPRGIYATEADERILALRDAPRRAAEAAEAELRLTRDQRREIQRALTLLDFNTRGIDGIFGRGTRSAIAAWQNDQGFEPSGYLDIEQIRRLDRLARARAEELEEEAQREAERQARQDRRYWRETGASGSENDLRAYLDRYPNGIFAEEARAELRAIEEIRRPRVSAVEQLTWQRVEQDGSAGAYQEYLRRYPNGAYATQAKEELVRLEEEASRGNNRSEAARREAAMNMSAATRRTIEQRLAALKYDPGRVDGNFDNQTRNALARYQADRRLPSTGYMNDQTMVRILADTVISIFD